MFDMVSYDLTIFYLDSEYTYDTGCCSGCDCDEKENDAPREGSSSRSDENKSPLWQELWLKLRTLC